MDFGYPELFVVPLGLGLLGFVEPCTIGGHLVFLRTLRAHSLSGRIVATLTFALIRALTMGSLGALAGLLGQRLIHAQTSLWLAFGSLYLVIGAAYAAGWAAIFKHRLDAAPAAWRVSANPVVLGIAFGLNIPACAAPILFGLIGLATSSGTILLGFAVMAFFGLALSSPLALLAASPAASSLAAGRLSVRPSMRWVFAIVFLALGAWSIWFGLLVDPADWSKL